MPKLLAIRTFETTIPSIPESKLTIKADINGLESEQIYQIAQDQPVRVTTFALSKLIVDWNLEDEAGQKLPITLENIQKLSATEAEELFYQTDFGKRAKEAQQKKTN